MPPFSSSSFKPLTLKGRLADGTKIVDMEVAEQLLLQHRLQLVEQQQLQQRQTQTQQRRVAAPRPHRPVPDHPPYAEMVGVALRALGEPGGSSERSISEYIVSSFTDLPPAHDKLLPYYLGKLVSSSYLCMPSPGRYLLFEEPNPESLPPHGGSCPAVAIQAPVHARGASPTPRRRGRPPKNRAAADVPAERPPSSARRVRGRPRKNPLSSPPRDAVQKRKLIGRPGAKHSNRSSVGSAATDMDREVGFSDEKEESGRPQNQPSMDVSRVSNASISLDYEADEEFLLLDPIHCLLEEDLLWGLPMQPEPEAKLLLPSTTAAAGQPWQPAMPMAELFGDKAALPLDSATAPATPTVKHCDPVQPPETSMRTEAVQLKKDEQVVLHHGQAQISVTMQGTVEENKMELQEVFN